MNLTGEHKEDLAALCQKHHANRLYPFGRALAPYFNNVRFGFG